MRNAVVGDLLTHICQSGVFFAGGDACETKRALGAPSDVFCVLGEGDIGVQIVRFVRALK